MRITSIWRSGSRCEWGALGAALVLGLVAARADAQGTVVGQLRLTERSGSASRDLNDAVVWLEPPRRLVVPASAPAPASGAIEMRGREFLPHVRVVRAGSAVSFPNDDPFNHNVFTNTTLGAFDLGLYKHGETRAAPFGHPGVYPIYCNIHHRMVSYVVAVPTPWAAQPAADGRFVLRDVPPGGYVLHAWHERGGEVTQRVDVRAEGATTVQLALDARAYVPAPHLNKFGLPYTATRADRY